MALKCTFRASKFASSARPSALLKASIEGDITINIEQLFYAMTWSERDRCCQQKALSDAQRRGQPPQCVPRARWRHRHEHVAHHWKCVVDKPCASFRSALPSAEIRKTITTGALMGARGNSGVITSQILRGLCEGLRTASKKRALPPRPLIPALASRDQDVAFQAVRKPVEGTILTVIKDYRGRREEGSQEEALAPMRRSTSRRRTAHMPVGAAHARVSACAERERRR